MPKKPTQPQNPHDDPAVVSANISSKSTTRTAIITVIGTVLVALIGVWSTSTKSCGSDVEQKKLVVRVSNETTNKAIAGAKVNLLAQDSITSYTDNEGRVTFSLSDISKEVRLTIEATDYNNYARVITPSVNGGVQEIKLQPIVPPPPSPPSKPTPTKSIIPIPNLNKPVEKYIASAKSYYEKADYQMALAQCDKALKIEPTNQEALELKKKIGYTQKVLENK